MAMITALLELLTLAPILLTVGEQDILQCTTRSRALLQLQSLTADVLPSRNVSGLEVHNFLESEEVVATQASTLQENAMSSYSYLGSAKLFFETFVKPQMKSIVQMMVLPVCICIIMLCINTIIDFMEENAVYFSSSLEGRVNSSFSSNNAFEAVQKQNQRSSPLCAELVSPTKNECLIVVPSLADIPADQSTYDTSILSKMGNPIVRITVSRLAQEEPAKPFKGLLGSSTGQVIERIEMSSWKRSQLLCYSELSKASEPANAEDSNQTSRRKKPSSSSTSRGGDEDSSVSQRYDCSIYRHTGEVFAVLEEAIEPSLMGQQVWTLSSADGSGWRLRIQGNVAQRSLTVMDEAGKQIVAVEPSGNLKFSTKSPSAKYFRLRAQPKVDAGVVLGALLAIDRMPGSHRCPRTPSAAHSLHSLDRTASAGHSLDTYLTSLEH